jgi:hypothetical protein
MKLEINQGYTTMQVNQSSKKKSSIEFHIFSLDHPIAAYVFWLFFKSLLAFLQ